MTNISIALTEPKSARYIYIDPKTNLVHVLLSVVTATLDSGIEIGLDNTCKAVYGPQEFFGKSRNAEAISALSSLKSYQEALEFDIGILKDDSVMKQQKASRLEQVKLYITFFENHKAHAVFNSLSLNFPKYPSPLKRLMSQPNSNLYSMVLRPVEQDSYLRTVNPVFSLKHRRLDDRGQIIDDEPSLFASTLLDSFQGTPIHRKDARTRVIAHVVVEEEKEADFNFDRLRERLEREMSQLSDSPIRLTKLNEKKQEETITQTMIDAWMGEYKPDSKEEYLDTLLNYAAPNFFDNLDSHFDSIQTGDDAHATERTAAHLSLLTQFFLGEANIHCFANGKTKTNWGERLDNSEALSQELAARLMSCVLNDNSIETALFDFINHHQSEFGLESDLTEDDKQQINTTFKAHYTQIKDAPHFDEFMVVDTTKKGLFVMHQGCACTDLTEFIQAAIDENKDLQNWSHYQFQRVRENFKAIQGALPHQNTLYLDTDGDIRFEIDIDSLSHEQLRAVIKRLPLDEQQKIQAHPGVQSRLLLPDFLLHIARGQQDQANRLLTSRDEQGQDIQALLLTPGEFTDYSGRTFRCTAFEYAYWAKDIYMCRMLLNRMDESTKAEMARRCEAINSEGLAYTLNGTPCKSAHFDFAPLKEAYQAYLDACQKKPKSRDEIGGAWFNIGKQQRLVPVHVANEYCQPERSFDPTPSFRDESLPRSLEFYNYETDTRGPWFPLLAGQGLGFDFALFKGVESDTSAMRVVWMWGDITKAGVVDLAAICGLDKVRTEQLSELYTQLSQTLGAGSSL